MDNLLPPQIKSFDGDTLAKIKQFKDSPLAQKYLLPKHDNFYVARFLRARKYDVDQAVQMFVSTMEWKKEVDVEKIKETLPQNPNFQKLLDYWPSSLHWEEVPTTKDGSLVLLEALGRVDPALIGAFGMDILVQFHIYCMEKLESRYWETSEKLGYWPGFIMIEDLEGLGYHSFSSNVLKVVKELVRINQNYYPEMLRKMYILNVPSFFYMFWKGIQLWMEPRSVAKMELINGNATVISGKITEIFDLSVLPTRLCGSSTKDIPKGGLIGDHSSTFREPPQNKVDLSRGTKYEVKVPAKVGDNIFYEFKTAEFDVGFSITCIETKKSVRSYERVDGSKMVIEGSFNPDTDGTYLFTFDNTYSWTRGKTVHFNIYSGTEILKF
eukprot:TRINITY_DN27990_c0_g1_i1.p1 TRINITY_DN27990_c0_g1~~TRINITY_DN27990_c0_g1_i1.p1  ORF type:complete len:382 (-),score=75.67 TRINITY_DN27990_c0_g1_i1:44-1189(-)